MVLNPNNAVEIYLVRISLHDSTYPALAYPQGDAVVILGFFPSGSE